MRNASIVAALLLPSALWAHGSHPFHALIQHANIDLRLGPLNWIISGPELHRWHHSRSLDEAMCNYGGTLILYDHLFRTYYRPAASPAPEQLGIGNMPGFPRGYLGQLATPVRWEELKVPDDASL